jgi:signal transduction histidine kinase
MALRFNPIDRPSPVNQTPSKVLVIDDERGPRESLRILLKNEFQVFCAESVDAGMELLKQHQPDAVIMDIRMPGKNGIEGLRAIRAMDQCVSVIMFTGFGALETAQEAIRLGANDYLKKPLDTHEIQQVVRHNVQRAQLERRRRSTEHDLSQLNQQLSEELMRKNHLAALGQKSAEVAHDLRNPLSAVLGYVELLGHDLSESKERLGDRWNETAEYLDIIGQSITRCRELSDMWLGLGKAAAQPKTAVSVRELLEEAIRETATLATQRAVSLDLQCRDDGYISVNRLQILRAVENLVTNAIEAAPEHSGRVQVRCHAESTHIEIGVSDNGSGIPHDSMLRVFEPFYTTKGKSGTGLGLFIAKEAVETNQGTIHLESKPDGGTVATISLPAVAF